MSQRGRRGGNDEQHDDDDGSAYGPQRPRRARSTASDFIYKDDAVRALEAERRRNAELEATLKSDSQLATENAALKKELTEMKTVQASMLETLKQIQQAQQLSVQPPKTPKSVTTDDDWTHASRSMRSQFGLTPETAPREVLQEPRERDRNEDVPIIVPKVIYSDKNPLPPLASQCPDHNL